MFKSSAVSSSKCSVCHGLCLLECTEFSVNDGAVADGNFQKIIKQMSASARPSMLCRAILTEQVWSISSTRVFPVLCYWCGTGDFCLYQ